MKKLISIFVLGALAVSALTFAGCGKSSSESTVTSKINVRESSVAETEAGSAKQQSSSTVTNWQASQSSQTSQSSQVSQTSGTSGLSAQVQSAALAVYGEGDGTVTLNSEETLDGQTFYHVTVSYQNGNSYPLVISSDGLAMTPSEFEAAYKGGSTDTDNNNSTADTDNGDEGDDNYVESYVEDGGDGYYGGYGPDGAQPY